MPLLGIEIVDFYRSYGVQDGYSLSLPTDVLFRAVFPQASPVSLLIPLPWGNSCAIEFAETASCSIRTDSMGNSWKCLDVSLGRLALHGYN